MKKYAESTLKGYTKEFLIEIIRCLEHNIEVLEERNSNQFKLLMQSEQYRWHDLRKNPKDLPEHEHDVEIVNDDGIHAIARYSYKESYYYGCEEANAWYEWENKYCCYDTEPWDSEAGGKIIAWREIGPFEEVEE